MSILPNAFPYYTPNQIPNIPIPSIVTKTENKPFKPKKAGTNGFHYFLILDESGSMQPLKRDTIGGIASFIEKQKEDKDNTKITIVKFSGYDVKIPVDGVDVHTIKEFKDYEPSSSTNLLDAVGFTLNKINDMLSGKRKKDRPSIFIQIITDGAENSSKNFNKVQIQEMVKSVENADWIVTYVGANVDSFLEASSLGINSNATANYSTTNTLDTYGILSESATRMKHMRSMGYNSSEIYASAAVYTEEDRTKMETK